MVADAQARQVVVVHDDDVFALVVADDGDFGDDVGVGVGGEAASGFGIEGGDEPGFLFHQFDRHLELAGDLGVFVAGDEVEVVEDEVGGEVVAAAEAAQLEPEAFAEVAGGDADGVEFLHFGEDVLELGEVFAGTGGEVLDGGGQEAVVIEAAEDQFGEAPLLVGQVGKGQLIHQVLLQRDGLRDGIHHELVARGVVAVGRGLVLGEVVFPLVVDLGDQVVFGQLVVAARVGGFGAFLGRGGRRVGWGFGRIIPAIFRGVEFGRGLVAGLEFLEGRVDLHLLLDQRAQFHDRNLEHLQGLAHLRRQRHLHALLLRLC